MKKVLFSVIVTMFTLNTLQLNAQVKKGAYASIHVGYSLAAGSSNALGLSNATITNTSQELEQIKFSFGKGVNAGLAFGYMFNEHIGAELGVQYLIGGKTKAKDTDNTTSFPYTQTADVSAKMLQINPSIVLATTINKISPYAKFGVVIGSGKITMNSNSVYPSSSYADRVELKGGTAIGFSAAMGLNIPISKNLSFSGELNMINMQYAPTKGNTTVYTINGVDKLSTLSVRDRETEFLKVITLPSTPRPNTLPRQNNLIAMPFGSIGINVGVKYHF
jgi:outer membrane protein W